MDRSRSSASRALGDSAPLEDCSRGYLGHQRQMLAGLHFHVEARADHFPGSRHGWFLRAGRRWARTRGSHTPGAQAGQALEAQTPGAHSWLAFGAHARETRSSGTYLTRIRRGLQRLRKRAYPQRGALVGGIFVELRASIALQEFALRVHSRPRVFAPVRARSACPESVPTSAPLQL